MQIPQGHGTFDKKTLIVASDNVQAKLYRAHGSDIEPIGVITSDHPPKENMERNLGEASAGSRAQGFATVNFSEQSDDLKTVSRDKLYHELNDELMRRVQDDAFDALILAAPQEHMAEAESALHQDVKARLGARVPKLLTNAPILDIVEQVKAAEELPE